MNNIKFNQIRIVLDDNGRGMVELNGVPLKYTTRVTFDAQANTPTFISITFLGDVEFNGPGQVQLIPQSEDEQLVNAL